MLVITLLRRWQQTVAKYLRMNSVLAFCFQVDMSKVNLDTVKPWVTQKITALLGFEDDVVIEFIFNQLDS
jgi:hypothetical protein